MTDTNKQIDDFIYDLPIVHQFGCPALERSDGGLMDYSCTCGNEHKAKAKLHDLMVRERIDEAKRAASHNNSEYTSDYLENRIKSLEATLNTKESSQVCTVCNGSGIGSSGDVSSTCFACEGGGSNATS